MKVLPAFQWLTAAVLLLSLPACQKKPEVKITSAEPTSFEAVTNHLDAGGNAYLYLSTDAICNAVSGKLATLGPELIASGKLDDASKAKATAAWSSFSKIVANSGIKEISGFGTSSIALAPSYYQIKWVTHHYPDKSSGWIWKLHGSTPNALDFTAYLPERTAAASSGNLKLTPIWEALNQEAAVNAGLRQGLDTISKSFESATGLNFASILASLGPNYSFLVTLDESRPTPLPINPSAPPVSLPEPGLAIFIQVQDDVLINRIDTELSKNPMVTKTDGPDLKIRTLAMPLPVAFLRPTVVWKKGLLMISTNDQLLRDMLDVKAGKKPGFAATNAEFKKLMTGLPTTGCSFGYVSPLFQKTVTAINQAQLEGNKITDPTAKKFLQFLYQSIPTKAVCHVVEETPEGWISTSHQEMVPSGK